jgi:hypothetical protein
VSTWQIEKNIKMDETNTIQNPVCVIAVLNLGSLLPWSQHSISFNLLAEKESSTHLPADITLFLMKCFIIGQNG